MEKLEPLHTAGRNMGWRKCFGKPRSCFSMFHRRLNILTMRLSNSIAGIHPRETWTYIHAKTCARILTAALFLIAKKSTRSPNVRELMPGWLKEGLSIQWSITQTKKAWSTNRAVIWTNRINIMLSERSQAQKTTYFMTALVRNVQKNQIHGNRKVGWWLPIAEL